MFKWLELNYLGVLSLLTVAVLLLSGIGENVHAQDGPEMRHEIKLRSRTFVPSPATAAMKTSSPRHAIVQFESEISAESVSAIEALGARVVSFVPVNAVVAHLPANTSLESVEDVRAVMDILRTDKLSPSISDSFTLGHFMVDVHAGVSSSEARAAIESAGGTIVPHDYISGDTYLVQGDESVAMAVSGADETAYLWNATEYILSGKPTRICGGALTTYGYVAPFATFGPGWDGDGKGTADLRYHFINGTPDLPGNTEEDEFRRAFDEWSRHVAVTFRETGTAGRDKSLDIQFAPDDGPFGSLAFAFFPSPPNSEPIAGDMSFDEDETWMIGSDFDLFTVALHETGHAIGLDHTDNSNAVMFASYQGVVTELHQDDINGAQSLYASTISGPIQLRSPTLLNTNGNTDKGGDANIAVATDGFHWVSVWQSNHNLQKNAGKDNDIFVAVDGTNTPRDWSGPSTLNSNADTDSGHDKSPDIATGGANDWVVVWQSDHSFQGNGRDWDILAATSLDNGATWSDPVNVNSIANTDSGNDVNPKIASDRNGNWICVWQSNHNFQGAGSDKDIMYAVSTDQGATWSPVQMLNSKAFQDTGNDSSPSIATDRAGKWVVAWHSSEPFRKSGHDNDIAYATSTDNGATWSRQLIVNRNSQGDSGQDKEPQLATDRNGNWLCVWQSNHDLKGSDTDNDIFVARSTNNGDSWGKTTRLNNNGKSDSQGDTSPRISTDTLGRWICVWETKEDLANQLGNDKDILYALSTNSGRTWSDPAALNTNADRDSGNDSKPFITNNEAGKWIMAWHSNHNLGNQADDDKDIFLTNEAEDLSGAP